MAKVIAVIDMPDGCGCLYCPFFRDVESIYVENGLYKAIARCQLADDSVSDPWMDMWLAVEHKAEWCPLKPLPDNVCLDDILKEENNNV